MPESLPGVLDKRRTIAGPGFNRWLVPPAALCVHLCIGMAYGFSVFWLPLTRAVGITQPVPCPSSLGLLGRLTTTSYDWDKPLLAPVTSPAAVTAMRPVNLLLLTGFWLFVTIPMGWGLWATIRQAAVLFW